MSITRLLLRLVTIQALTNATFAEDRVEDSQIVPLEKLVEGQPLPVLVVYTDDDDRPVKAKELFEQCGGRKLSLVVEVTVATKVTVPVENGETEEAIVIPGTDEGLEITLDLIEAQISRALVNPKSQWAQRWLLLVDKINQLHSIRGASAEKGSRFAARQITFIVEPISDPAPGEVLAGTAWGDALDYLEACDETTKVARAIRAVLAEPDALVPWQVIQAQLGVTAEGAAALGFGPLQDTLGAPIVSPDTGEPPTVSEITLDVLNDDGSTASTVNLPPERQLFEIPT